MDYLLEKITETHKIGHTAQKALASKVQKITLDKGGFLVEESKTCNRLFFLERGSVRGYYNLDGKEITHWFGFESDFITSFYSFITEKPSLESVQTLETSVLWAITKKDLISLYDDYPEIERFVRMTYEKLYIRLEERYVNAQFKTAKQRYNDLLDTNPQIIQRVPLGYIASFLGISQETLSRTRAKPD